VLRESCGLAATRRRALPSRTESNRDIDPLRCRVANVAKPVLSLLSSSWSALVRSLARSLAERPCCARTSVRPSVRPSVRTSVRPSIHIHPPVRWCGKNSVALAFFALAACRRHRRHRDRVSILSPTSSFSLSLSLSLSLSPSRFRGDTLLPRETLARSASRRRDKDDESRLEESDHNYWLLIFVNAHDRPVPPPPGGALLYGGAAGRQRVT